MLFSNLQCNFKLSAIALALSLTLTACTFTETSAPSYDVSTNQAFSSLNMSKEQYQDILTNADADSRFPAMILVARSSIQAQDYATAESMLLAMQTEAITPLQQDEARLIEAQLKLHQGKLNDAKILLSRVNTRTFPQVVSSFYYQLSSNVELNLYQTNKDRNHLIKACNDKITLLNYVNAESQKIVCEQIVNHLKGLPAYDLVMLSTQNQEPVFKGFIEYALLDSTSSASVKSRMLSEWLQKYPDHPLEQVASSTITSASTANAGSNLVSMEQITDETANTNVSLKEGDRLAILLPLTGRFAANVGEPARLGILAALQDRNSKLKVTFYDTNRMTMPEIVSAMVQNGTNFIIGPILKPEVDALISTDIKLPSIVFNQPSTERSNLYYFDLGPDYEGTLAARKIAADRHISPLVIAPESTRGQRAIQGFNNTWDQSNTKRATVCRYNTVDTILSDLTTCPLNTADAIYMNGTSVEVIKAKTALPPRTPLYLTNRSFTGVNLSSSEVALSGANMGDMPWLLTDSDLKRDLMATLPQADTQVQRIFATAYDSINLGFNLGLLLKNTNDTLHGISGDLKIGKKGLIEMSPMWVQLSVNRTFN